MISAEHITSWATEVSEKGIQFFALKSRRNGKMVSCYVCPSPYTSQYQPFGKTIYRIVIDEKETKVLSAQEVVNILNENFYSHEFDFALDN